MRGLIFLSCVALGLLAQTIESDTSDQATEYVCWSARAISTEAASNRTDEQCQDECYKNCSPEVVGDNQRPCLEQFLGGCAVTAYRKMEFAADSTCSKPGALWRLHFDLSNFDWTTKPSALALTVYRSPHADVLTGCVSGTFKLAMMEDKQTGAQHCEPGSYPTARGEEVSFLQVGQGNAIIMDVTDWFVQRSGTIQSLGYLDLVPTGCCATQLDSDELATAYLKVYYGATM